MEFHLYRKQNICIGYQTFRNVWYHHLHPAHVDRRNGSAVFVLLPSFCILTTGAVVVMSGIATIALCRADKQMRLIMMYH